MFFDFFTKAPAAFLRAAGCLVPANEAIEVARRGGVASERRGLAVSVCPLGLRVLGRFLRSLLVRQQDKLLEPSRERLFRGV